MVMFYQLLEMKNSQSYFKAILQKVWTYGSVEVEQILYPGPHINCVPIPISFVLDEEKQMVMFCCEASKLIVYTDKEDERYYTPVPWKERSKNPSSRIRPTLRMIIHLDGQTNSFIKFGKIISIDNINESSGWK
ncbi:hypothetical protein YC2023_061051 [Brassica napus]